MLWNLQINQLTLTLTTPTLLFLATVRYRAFWHIEDFSHIDILPIFQFMSADSTVGDQAFEVIVLYGSKRFMASLKQRD